LHGSAKIKKATTTTKLIKDLCRIAKKIIRIGINFFTKGFPASPKMQYRRGR